MGETSLSSDTARHGSNHGVTAALHEIRICGHQSPMATCALLALAASSLGWVAPGVQPLRARVQPIRRTAVIRSDGLEAEPFSLASSRQRMADSYREGVEKSRRYFKSDRFAAAESFAPLRGSDRIACIKGAINGWVRGGQRQG